jgi:hypothetical protein
VTAFLGLTGRGLICVASCRAAIAQGMEKIAAMETPVVFPTDVCLTLVAAGSPMTSVKAKKLVHNAVLCNTGKRIVTVREAEVANLPLRLQPLRVRVAKTAMEIAWMAQPLALPSAAPILKCIPVTRPEIGCPMERCVTANRRHPRKHAGMGLKNATNNATAILRIAVALTVSPAAAFLAPEIVPTTPPNAEGTPAKTSSASL